MVCLEESSRERRFKRCQGALKTSGYTSRDYWVMLICVIWLEGRLAKMHIYNRLHAKPWSRKLYIGTFN